MDYWAVTYNKCAETEMGKDSFLERKIFKISNALSTQVPGAKKIHKHTTKNRNQYVPQFCCHFITFAKDRKKIKIKKIFVIY